MAMNNGIANTTLITIWTPFQINVSKAIAPKYPGANATAQATMHPCAEMRTSQSQKMPQETYDPRKQNIAS